MPGEDDVNFERVTKVYREETGRKTLLPLEVEFYDKLAAYLVRLEEAANREASANPSSPKAILLQDELRKARKKRDQIFTYRERKLTLLASARASGTETEVPNLPRQERALFEELVALLQRARKDAFGPPPSGRDAVPQEAPPPAARTPAKPAAETMRVVTSEDTKMPRVAPGLKDHVVVHVLEDLPPFAGIDTTYHLKKEDVVTLPKTIAQILVDRGKARLVQVAGAGS